MAALQKKKGKQIPKETLSGFGRERKSEKQVCAW